MSAQADPEKSQASPQPEPHATEMDDSSETQEEALKLDNAEAPVVDEYVHGARLAVLAVSLMLGMFLVALDNVCIYTSKEYATKG